MKYDCMYNIPYTELKSGKTRIYIPVIVHYCECHGVNAIEAAISEPVAKDLINENHFVAGLTAFAKQKISELPSKSFVNQNGELCLS